MGLKYGRLKKNNVYDVCGCAEEANLLSAHMGKCFEGGNSIAAEYYSISTGGLKISILPETIWTSRFESNFLSHTRSHGFKGSSRLDAAADSSGNYSPLHDNIPATSPSTESIFTY